MRNTAVHLSSEPKSNAHMRWLPDLDFAGNASVSTRPLSSPGLEEIPVSGSIRPWRKSGSATVAQSRKVFWVRHPARKLQVILDVVNH
ncbi:hypothetical protein J6590_097760 [Homalodisca vitripennis]|nr:hypothetical protein J6590_097760 [Homalodisca vitripennis]